MWAAATAAVTLFIVSLFYVPKLFFLYLHNTRYIHNSFMYFIKCALEYCVVCVYVLDEKHKIGTALPKLSFKINNVFFLSTEKIILDLQELRLVGLFCFQMIDTSACQF